MYLRSVQAFAYSSARFKPHGGTPGIVIHPHYEYAVEGLFSPRQTTHLLEDREGTPGYLETLDAFVTQHDGPLILLEEGPRMVPTIERFRRLGRADDLYCIYTRRASGTPLAGWTPLHRLLSRFTGEDPEEVILAGGYLNWQGPFGMTGCLGSVLRQVWTYSRPVPGPVFFRPEHLHQRESLLAEAFNSSKPISTDPAYLHHGSLQSLR